MRRPIHSSRALRGILLFSFAALALLAGCRRFHRSEFRKPAKQINPHSVTISWNASPSPAAGYNVYRKTAHGGPILLAIRISGTQYTDRTVVAGETYSYSVTSVDTKGRESKPSADITVTVPTTVTPPAAY